RHPHRLARRSRNSWSQSVRNKSAQLYRRLWVGRGDICRRGTAARSCFQGIGKALGSVRDIYWLCQGIYRTCRVADFCCPENTVATPGQFGEGCSNTSPSVRTPSPFQKPEKAAPPAAR